MLTIHVRKVRPGTLVLTGNTIVRVLVGNSRETRRVDALVPGDLIEAHGVVTRVERDGGSRMSDAVMLDAGDE